MFQVFKVNDDLERRLLLLKLILYLLVTALMLLNQVTSSSLPYFSSSPLPTKSIADVSVNI